MLAAVLLPAGTAHARITCAADAPGGDWKLQGQNLSSDRTQPAEKVIESGQAALLQPIWTFDANRWTHVKNNEVTGYPVIADGCVYVGSSTGNGADGAHLPGYVFALNAANGDVVWQTQVAGGVYSTVAVDAGVVYAFVSRVGSPYVVALDQRTGEVLWETVVDRQAGSDAVASPVVYKGLLWVGVSGTAAEGDASDRTAFQGSSVLIATKRLKAPVFKPLHAPAPTKRRKVFTPGQIVRRAYSIPPAEWPKGFAGGAQWGTIAIDPTTGYGYEGTGNPFNYDFEHANTNAVLKLDLDRTRATFGQYTGSYKGEVEAYYPGVSATQADACRQVESVSVSSSTGVECLRLDLDFGTTPNIYTDGSGRRVVSAGQKSGIVHFFDARTMKPIAETLVGVPSPVGGVVGSAAYDGRRLIGPHTVAGYMWAIDADSHQVSWLAPIGDAVHWGPPVTAANGVVYTVDLLGFLDAFDATTGQPLLHLPMSLGSDTRENPPLSWGGVSIARHTIFASVGVGLTSAGLPSLPNGYVIAYQPLRPPVR